MANTGNVIVTERDTNPFSPTYNTTRTRTYEDLTLCPVPEVYKLKYYRWKNTQLNPSLTRGTIACSVGTQGVATKDDLLRIESDGWRVLTLQIGSCVNSIRAEFMYDTYSDETINSLWIADTVTSIGNKAFYGCSSLREITVFATTPPVLGTLVFYGSSCPIYVPVASVSAYQAAWSEYASRIRPIEE